MTDPLILLKVQLHRGLSHADACSNLDSLKAAMVEFALNNKPPQSEASGLVLLPGVKALLERLHQRSDVHVGLCTGNLEPIAWSKMEALGIRHLFSDPPCGGFGSDYCSNNIENGAADRAQLVATARKRVAAARGGDEQIGRWCANCPSDVPLCGLAPPHVPESWVGCRPRLAPLLRHAPNANAHLLTRTFINANTHMRTLPRTHARTRHPRTHARTHALAPTSAQ